jgi:short-subunit dehydrogenase
MRIALITGASSGMGREFVLQLDAKREYDEIWALARREDRLEALRNELRAKLRPIPADLTKPETQQTLRELLEREKPEICDLVNAAGFGRFGVFRDLTADEQAEMIDRNVKALTAVTHMALPYMKAGGRIYNLGSLSSFQPVPYMLVYGATKAYVLSFSRALNAELKKTGIRVMAVCPGWVRTEFFDRAATDDTITYYNRYYDPDDVVRRALRDMERGKDVSVLGLPVRNQVRAVKLLPHRLVMKIWCRQQKK